MIASLKNGLGQNLSFLSLDSVHSASHAFLSSQILLLVALMLSKSSLVLLLRRIFSGDMLQHLIVCDVLLGVCVAWGIGSMLAVSVGCSPSTLIDGQCSGQVCSILNGARMATNDSAESSLAIDWGI